MHPTQNIHTHTHPIQNMYTHTHQQKRSFEKDKTKMIIMILNKKWVNCQIKEHKPKRAQTKIRAKWLKICCIQNEIYWNKESPIAMLYN